MMSLEMIQYTNAVLNGGGFCEECHELTSKFAYRFPDVIDDDIGDLEEPRGLCLECLDNEALDNY